MICWIGRPSSWDPLESLAVWPLVGLHSGLVGCSPELDLELRDHMNFDTPLGQRNWPKSSSSGRLPSLGTLVLGGREVCLLVLGLEVCFGNLQNLESAGFLCRSTGCHERIPKASSRVCPRQGCSDEGGMGAVSLFCVSRPVQLWAMNGNLAS